VRLAVQASGHKAASLFSLWSSHRDWIDKRRPLPRALVNLSGVRDTLAAALPHGDKRKLEVAIMMALEPRVFMFDEPTAGMSVDEVPVILDLIHALKKDGSKTILLVEHKMDVVRSLADRIVVLHNGQPGGRRRARRGHRLARRAGGLSRPGAQGGGRPWLRQSSPICC
jgi:branched-chain amino acid transport system ATP-binding protein